MYILVRNRKFVFYGERETYYRIYREVTNKMMKCGAWEDEFNHGSNSSMGENIWHAQFQKCAINNFSNTKFDVINFIYNLLRRAENVTIYGGVTTKKMKWGVREDVG
eukprot:GEMP01024479.1.p1 GENE.GEMP01024479.1~~GEMP01024479.1.p1  ORF type:complete len:107 (-),score=4.40 GEMP01024479.1:405-725(-)